MIDYRSRYQSSHRAKAGPGWWAEWGPFLFVVIVAACLLLALAYPVLFRPDALPAFKASQPPDPAQKAAESAALDRIGVSEAAPPATDSRARGSREHDDRPEALELLLPTTETRLSLYQRSTR